MASDQIRQMVNFILQEAHEKANEIRVKVGVDFFHILCAKMTRQRRRWGVYEGWPWIIIGHSLGVYKYQKYINNRWSLWEY